MRPILTSGRRGGGGILWESGSSILVIRCWAWSQTCCERGSSPGERVIKILKEEDSCKYLMRKKWWKRRSFEQYLAGQPAQWWSSVGEQPPHRATAPGIFCLVKKTAREKISIKCFYCGAGRTLFSRRKEKLKTEKYHIWYMMYHLSLSQLEHCSCFNASTQQHLGDNSFKKTFHYT